MTTVPSQLSPIDTGTAKVSLAEGPRIAFQGEIGSREPDKKIVDYIDKAHQWIRESAATDVVVDIRQLSFVNSSNIRIFIDWVIRAKGEGDAPHYRIRFLAKRTVTWQRLMLGALASLATDTVVVDFEDRAGATT
jgi:hypothetical protein